MIPRRVIYSHIYRDDEYEYRHVTLPRNLAKLIPKQRLMVEWEWRQLGVQQSPEWEHYVVHAPAPHILLFRRPRPSAQ